MYKIKVLLATYNGSKYIVDQLTSIINQKDVNINIVIQDDGSTDDTLNLVSKDFFDLTYFVNDPGTGSAARNFVKMVCEMDFNEQFEYVAFSDQDDVWLPEKLYKAIEFLKKENADLYCSNLTKWDISNNSYSELKKDFPQKKFDYLFEGGSAGCTYVFTQKFARELQTFFNIVDSSDWPHFSHDWLIYFFARSRDFKVVIDGQSYIHYRIHEHNVHGHLNKISWNTIKEKSSQVFDGYYQNHIRNFIKYLNSLSLNHL
ncbi:glycosyltransferase [Sphingobacterium siyangense]|uniref:glycosyltransferase n=1 Tax=Sphingobacterium siyangense TaxID=459529 RepID=UPI003DA245A2